MPGEGGIDPGEELDVARTVHSLFHHLDGGAFARAAALFAQDGVWVRQGEQLTGPAGVAAALAARPADLHTRHIVTNLLVSATPDGARAVYYTTVFDHRGPDRPAPLTGPGAIFVNEDALVRTGDGWRFRHRQPTLAFRKDAPR